MDLRAVRPLRSRRVYLCTDKDNNNLRSRFGYNCNTRKREVRVPRKNYKGMSIEVGSKRKEISLKSTKLKLTSKKLKRSGMDEVIQLKGSIFGDDESCMSVQSSEDIVVGAQSSEDIVGVQSSEDIVVGAQSSEVVIVGATQSSEDVIVGAQSSEDIAGAQSSEDVIVAAQSSEDIV